MPAGAIGPGLRIAIVTHVVDRNDGQGRVNHEIVVAALAAGCEVTLLASHVAAQWRAHPHVRWVRVSAGGWPTALLRYQVFAARSAWWLMGRRHGFDILHVNGFITWARADVNTAHFVHGGWLRSPHYPFTLRGGPYSGYQLLYTRINAWLEGHAFRRARAVVAVSPRIAGELAQIGVDAGRIETIANGVDTAEFRPGNGDRAGFGLPPGVPLLLFAGDLRTPRKNLDTVLAALALGPDNVALAVAGQAQGSPYPRMAAELGLARRVHFLGHVSAMPALMRCCDVLVFPSRYEPMGLVVLEAMASGLAVITARTTGASGLVPDAAGVVLADPDDAAALAGAIRACTAEPQRTRCMGAAARAAMLPRGWAAMGEQYLALYRRLSSTEQENRPPDARHRMASGGAAEATR